MDKKLFVKHNAVCKLYNYKFQLANATHGDPQGSSLGPLLFLMYVNDLPQPSQFQTMLFAYDLYLTMAENSFAKLKSKVSNELLHIDTWLKQNKVSLNSSKSCYMLTDKNSRKFCESDLILNLVYLVQTTRSQISWHMY